MTTYRPVGTAVLFRVLPQKVSESMLFLPDGTSRPGEIRRWEILAIGNEVNDEKFQLKVGEIVILGGGHPGEGIWLEKDKIVLFDRRRVVAIEESIDGQN